MAQGLPVLPVIRNLGGCGGTLVSRLFGALPRTVVLSETNPRSASLFGGHLNALKQLRKWHPELLDEVADFDDAEIGYPPRFGEMLQGIAATAERCGKRLMLRDFNYADFIGPPFVWPPAKDASLDAALAGRFDPISLLLVRHPADQLASLRSHRALQLVLTAERFVAGNLAFLMCFRSAPVFRYEELLDAPEASFRSMCERLDFPFAHAALTEFVHVGAVTGSLTRAAESQIAAAAPSAEAALARQELAALPEYRELLDRLGYRA
jgi:hypothetical protein